MIIVSNLETVITARLLDALARYNISLVICDNKFHPSGVFTGLNTHSRATKIMRQQLDWDDEFKNYTWMLIITAKIINQRDVLKKREKNISSIELLNKNLTEITLGDKSNKEGHSAKVYFNALFGLDFVRSNDDNVINACLNYGYAVIRALFARLIVAYGFTGLLGICHKNEFNNFNLVDDLMEVFRPIYDDYVISNFDEKTIFNFDTREKIVDFLNIKIKYEGRNLRMMNAIEKFVINFVTYTKNKDVSVLNFPMVTLDE